MKQVIQITSGRGPAECCWVVAQVLKKIVQEATESDLTYEVLHREPADENSTLKAATVRLEGDNLEEFLKSWVGTIQWVGQSQFRKLHKRKNWFVGVNRVGDAIGTVDFKEADIRYEFTRSGGPGGQHVNKVSTAVRATHLPSREVVFVSEGRSQLQNKNEARRRLLKKLEEKVLLEIKDQAKEGWANHDQLERGNPVRVFKGSDFKTNHVKKTHKSERKQVKQKGFDEYND